MFSIIAEQAMKECSRLENQVSELFGSMIELNEITKELRSLSYMTEPVASLEHKYSELDFQYDVLRQMMLALNKAILNYMSCENRICDNGEENVIHYVRRRMEVNDLSDISNILSGF